MITYYTYKCAFCGKTFKSRFMNRKYCSLSCAARKNGKPVKKSCYIDVDKERRQRKKEHAAMLERLRKRDEEYARQFPDFVRHHVTWTSQDSESKQAINEHLRRFF